MVSRFRLNTFMSKEVSITMCYVGGGLKKIKITWIIQGKRWVSFATLNPQINIDQYDHL